MVNLASRAFDENKSMLMDHSRKIKKASPDHKQTLQHQKHHEIKHYHWEMPSRLETEQIGSVSQDNHAQQIAMNVFKSHRSASSLPVKFESYQPIFNYMICPEAIQEIFSMKSSLSFEEIRRRIYDIKTPLSPEVFHSSIERMKVLTSNHDLLIQSYLKDKYTSSESPNPELLSEYYRYVKRKLSLGQIFEAQMKQYPKGESKSNDQIQNSSAFKKDDLIQKKSQYHLNQGFLDSLTSKAVPTPFSLFGGENFEERREEEEFKTSFLDEELRRKRKQDQLPNFTENLLDDLWQNMQEEPDEKEPFFALNSKFPSNQKNVAIGEDDFGFSEKERLYSIL